jgi:hypothetical protein
MGELARRINPVVRGWMQYYGAFYRSALHPFLAEDYQAVSSVLRPLGLDRISRIARMIRAV